MQLLPYLIMAKNSFKKNVDARDELYKNRQDLALFLYEMS